MNDSIQDVDLPSHLDLPVEEYTSVLTNSTGIHPTHFFFLITFCVNRHGKLWLWLVSRGSYTSVNSKYIVEHGWTCLTQQDNFAFVFYPPEIVWLIHTDEINSHISIIPQRT